MRQLRQALQARLRGTSTAGLCLCLPVRCYAAAASGRWTCACGLHNFDFHRECYSCHKVRPGTAAAEIVSPLSLLDGIQMEDATVATPPPPTPAAAAVRPVEGVWMCPTCYTFNGAERCACTYCQQTRPRLQTPTDGAVAVHRNAASSRLDASAAASRPLSDGGAASTPRAQRVRSGDWFCACGEHNFGRNAQCRKCGALPSAEKLPRETARAKGRAGDWVCRECQMYNFSRRTECKRCGAAQPASARRSLDQQLQQQKPEASHASAAAQGWVCDVCHSLNPDGTASSTCVICGSAHSS